MSLRITQGILFSHALQDIRNTQLGFARIQRQAATGQRVNAPSDDPVAMLRILPLTTQIRDLDQMLENVHLAQESITLGTSNLEDASEIMQRVRELTVQAANGSISDEGRRSIGEEVDQLLQQMVAIANSSRAGRYLFGGTETLKPPFSVVDDDGGSRAVYDGNQRSLSVLAAPGIETQLNIPGDEIFLSRSRGSTEIDGLTGAAPSGAADSGIGFQTLQVRFSGLHTDAPAEIVSGAGQTSALGPLTYVFTTGPDTLSIGGGPALPVPATDQDFVTGDGRTINLTVIGVPPALTGSFTSKAALSNDGGTTEVEVTDFSDTDVQVRNSFDGSVLNLDVTALDRTGSDRVKFNGTFDVFTTLISLRDILRNEAGDPSQVVTARASQMLDEIDNAHDLVLDGLRELGFRSNSLDTLRGRVESTSTATSESLSRLRDIDLAETILEMQRQELAYQASLQVGARALQTSLLSFLG